MFHDEVKNKYPKMPLEGMKDIVTSPWFFMREIMEGDDLEKFRMKYFGVFFVTPYRAKEKLEWAKKKFQNNTLAPKQYFKIKANIERYLENFKDEEEEE